ncbi:MAG: protein kinase [Thermoanaerobaculia bacterium]
MRNLDDLQPVDPGRWARLEEILDRLLDEPAGQRAALLDQLCDADRVLRREVERLLAGSVTHNDILDQPVSDGLGDLVESVAGEAETDAGGRRVGKYRLLERLGRGGMGVVYLAERAEGDFEQRVAIKFVPQELDVPELRRRFLAERRILAALQHPNIARLLDGGVTDEGTPYIVMEHIDGVPIDCYCDDGGLGLGARLKLLLAVCSAVQAAHQNLVIHRDLKPANILVTGDGVVKLLDFGIAKLLGDGEGQTRTLLQPLTPEYAAPEQVTGGPITTATDVYALGVVAYRLLTGRPPYEFSDLTPQQVAEEVTHGVIEAPSLVAIGGKAPVPARRLKGDLDNIVLKALAKESRRRYGSVRELADDFERFERGLPVTARPSSRLYRAQKLMRRHTVGVVATALVVLALLAGLAGTAWQARVAGGERDRAEGVAALVLDLLRMSDPDLGGGTTLTAAELLQSAAGIVNEQLAEQPEMRLRLLETIGEGLHNLQRFELSPDIMAEVVALNRSLYGEQDPRLAKALLDYGRTLGKAGRIEEADPAILEALTLRREIFGERALEVAEVLDARILALGENVSNTDRRMVEDVPRLIQEVLGIYREQGAEESAGYARALHVFGQDAILQYFRARRSPAEAKAGVDAMREAVAVQRRVLGEGHESVAETLNDLALGLDGMDLRDEAIAALEEALAIYRQRLGADHPNAIIILANLAGVRIEHGQYEVAEKEIQEVLARWRKMLPEETSLDKVAFGFAELYVAMGDAPAARPWVERAVIRGEALGSSRQLQGQSLLGALYTLEMRFEEAEPLLLEAHEGLVEEVGSRRLETRKAAGRLRRLYERWGRPELAAPYIESASPPVVNL